MQAAAPISIATATHQAGYIQSDWLVRLSLLLWLPVEYLFDNLILIKLIN
jgi:hypothetical protein